MKNWIKVIRNAVCVAAFAVLAACGGTGVDGLNEEERIAWNLVTNEMSRAMYIDEFEYELDRVWRCPEEISDEADIEIRAYCVSGEGDGEFMHVAFIGVAMYKVGAPLYGSYSWSVRLLDSKIETSEVK